jgi:FkbM family methyltransferase
MASSGADLCSGDPSLLGSRQQLTEFLHLNGHSLLAAPLMAGINVLDLGANHGIFATLLSARYPGRYGGVEANPALIDELRAGAYDWVRHCAVSDAPREVPFRIARNDAASSMLELPNTSIYDAIEVETIAVEGVPLADLLRQAGERVDVLKVDVEGAEVPALASLSPADLARIGQITVEFHSDPTFQFGLTLETDAVIQQLRNSGFVALDFEPGQKDMLFINRARYSVSRLREAYWKTIAGAARWRIIVGAERRRLAQSVAARRAG